MTEGESRQAAIVELSDRRDREAPRVEDDASAIEEDDYRDLVGAAARLALIGFVSKAISSIVLARLLGATIEIRRLFGWFPYLGIRATRPVFADVVTWSSVLMTIAVIVAFALTIRRPAAIRTRRQRAAGAFVGPLVVALTFALEFIRHLRYPPVLDLRWAALCLGALALASAVGIITFPRDRRRAEPQHDDQGSGDLVPAR